LPADARRATLCCSVECAETLARACERAQAMGREPARLWGRVLELLRGT
jgi:hypothetical protein